MKLHTGLATAISTFALVRHYSELRGGLAVPVKEDSEPSQKSTR